MRFCPFCGAENADDSAQCVVCARKLPAPVVRKPSSGVSANPPAEPALLPPPPAPRAASASIPPPLPPAAAAAPPRAPTPSIPPPTPQDRAASVPPNGKNGNLGLPPPPVDVELLREVGRAADGSRPLPTPTPSQRYGRDATESALATRELQLPEIEEARKALSPMPVVPDSGLYEAAKYAVQFVQARWQRRKAILALSADVVKETASLDGVLGELGKAARQVNLDGKVFADENNAISEAERRRTFAEQSCEDLTAKKAEENAKFETVQGDLTTRLAEREQIFAEIAAELARLEAQRRGLRDKKKDVEKKLRAVLKSAEEREEQAAKSPMGDARQSLREGASGLRKEARQIEEEKNDIESRLAGLEKPFADVSTRHDQARGDVELSRKDLENAREGHRHRTTEIEAETARRFSELRQSESEIARRLVTLGTIVNLNRVEKPEFMPLFERADQLRALISARETEADRLTAEQHAYDRPSLIRGGLVLTMAIILLSTVIWLVKWLLTRG
jgi:predicted  nucleic acid-binding Zn-ribbon protein